MDKIEVVRAKDLSQASRSQGVTRQEAYADAKAWAGIIRTEPGETSPWHDHGDADLYLYVVEGRSRLEFGEKGRSVVEAGPGDFVRIPAHTVHRESNPGTREAVLIAYKTAGRGPFRFEAEPPEGARERSAGVTPAHA